MSLKFFSSFTRPRFLNAAPADSVYTPEYAHRVFLFQEFGIAVFAVEAIGGSKISGPPKIKGSEGCVSSYRYRITRYFDFPTTMFSSKIATFKLYIEFLDFFK